MRRKRPTLGEFDALVSERLTLRKQLEAIERVIEENAKSAAAGVKSVARVRSVARAFDRGLERGRCEGLEIALTAVRRIAGGGVP